MKKVFHPYIRAGSIADDARFKDLAMAWSCAVFGPNDKAAFPTWNAMVAYIDARQSVAAPEAVQGKASDAEAWQVQIWSGDHYSDFWKPVLAWDCGHTIKVDTFPGLTAALVALAIMEDAYDEHSFRVHPLATPTAETVKGAGE